MQEMTLQELAQRMSEIDFAMLSTRTEGGAMASRPMSNNGDVDYQGTSFFFSFESSRTISDIRNDAKVGLTFTGAKGLLGRPPIFIAIEGTAELIMDKSAFAAHWNKDLDYWFSDGIDTPGVVLIKVRADRIHYWDGNESGEVAV